MLLPKLDLPSSDGKNQSPAQEASERWKGMSKLHLHVQIAAQYFSAKVTESLALLKSRFQAMVAPKAAKLTAGSDLCPPHRRQHPQQTGHAYASGT